MSRIRYLKPDFFIDEDIAELNYEVRLFYQGLWCSADKAGRLEDRPKKLKVQILPYDNIDPEKILNILAKPKNTNTRAFIIRYEVEKEKYIQIVSWDRHQKPHHTEKESLIPPYNPPLKTKTKRKIKTMGKINQLNASSELDNGSLTVKVFAYWNNGAGIKHVVLDDKIKVQINLTLKQYTIEQIKQGIDNYKFIRESPDHKDGAKWSLVQFLKQSNGLAVFLDLEGVKERYKKNKPSQQTNSKYSDSMKRIADFSKEEKVKCNEKLLVSD